MQASEMDMINRDPNDINDHLKVAFEDVLAEPDGAHSISCVWRCAFHIFNCSKAVAYNLLTIIYGLPLAMYWGCEFAYITFIHVWEITPCLRVLMIECGVLQKIWNTCLHCCLGPVCENCGLLFSNIVVKNQ
ncbi:caveolin-1-like [Babylonia areolata]|uniref:caveolin-1-like n=1 Tax=Babylonia areolata TaxID=304850 RepID=UPI003FD4D5AB